MNALVRHEDLMEPDGGVPQLPVISLLEIFGAHRCRPDVPNWMYHTDRSCVSASGLKEMLKSPAHYQAYLALGSRETPAKFMGSALHTRLLEPEEFDATYVVIPDEAADRRTHEFRAFERANPEKILITEKQAYILNGVFSSVSAHPTAADLLRRGFVEHTILHQDEETGIWLKIRPDCLCLDFDTGICLDLKSTDSAEKTAFRRSCERYDYDVQAAIYLDVLRKVFERDFDWAFLAMEKEAPFGVALYGAPEEMIASGRQRYREALRTLKQCLDTGEWPCYQPEGGYDILDWPRRRRW